MAQKKTIYRTVFQFEVLSEEPICHSLGLDDIHQEITNGDCTGRMLDNKVTNKPLKGMAAVKAMKDVGSDTEFFNFDEKGNELED
jgi:predicted transcriptional regulator YheO